MAFTKNRYALRVRDALSRICRKLTKEEYAGLEADIISLGFATDPIIVCRESNEIIDGEHRWEICEKHQLGYKIELLDIRPDECIPWIIRRQSNRRNLSTAERESIAKAMMDHLSRGKNGKISPKKSIDAVAEATGSTKETAKKRINRARKTDKLSTKIKIDYDAGNVKLTDKELNTLTKLPLVDQAALYTTVKSGEFKDIGEALESKGYMEPAKPPAAEEPDAPPAEEVNPITGKAENIHGKKLFKTLNSDLGKVVRGIDAIGKQSKNKSHYNTCLMRAEELYKAIEVWTEIEAIG